MEQPPGKQEGINVLRIIVVLLLLLMVMASCQNTERISLWDRHCAACHDGKTMLNNRVVMDKEQLKAKYKSLAEFADACSLSPSCMNIVRHEKKLLTDVGREIGLKETSK